MGEVDSWIWILFGVTIFLVILIPFVFYLLTLQRTLEAIAIESRTMPPGQVWLMFIPIFNVVWMFIMNARLSDSIKNECARLHIATSETRPVFTLGLTMCILFLFSNIPDWGSFISIGALVVWILYWIKVNDYRKLIIANQNNELFDAERDILETTPQ